MIENLSKRGFVVVYLKKEYKRIILLKINNNIIYLHDKMQIGICSSKYVINTILLDIYNLYIFLNKLYVQFPQIHLRLQTEILRL